MQVPYNSVKNRRSSKTRKSAHLLNKKPFLQMFKTSEKNAIMSKSPKHVWFEFILALHRCNCLCACVFFPHCLIIIVPIKHTHTHTHKL